MHEKLWITKDNLASWVLLLLKCVIKYCNFLHIVVPSSEAGGLAHGILHSKGYQVYLKHMTILTVIVRA